MKIRFLTSMAGPHWKILPGEVVDFPDEAARAQIAAGNAEPVDPPAAPELPRGRRR